MHAHACRRHVTSPLSVWHTSTSGSRTGKKAAFRPCGVLLDAPEALLRVWGDDAAGRDSQNGPHAELLACRDGHGALRGDARVWGWDLRYRQNGLPPPMVYP